MSINIIIITAYEVKNIVALPLSLIWCFLAHLLLLIYGRRTE